MLALSIWIDCKLNFVTWYLKSINVCIRQVSNIDFFHIALWANMFSHVFFLLWTIFKECCKLAWIIKKWVRDVFGTKSLAQLIIQVIAYCQVDHLKRPRNKDVTWSIVAVCKCHLDLRCCRWPRQLGQS